MVTILVVEDHPLFRNGFAHAIGALRPDWRLCFAACAAEARAIAPPMAPALAIIDIGLPDDSGFDLAATLHTQFAGLPIILLSGREDAAVRVRARASGARSFIAKALPPELIVRTIEVVLAGGTVWDPAEPHRTLPQFTQRQAEVLTLLAEGHGNKEIRHRLGIAERTVRAHLTELFQLLGAHSRTQALIRARELGLLG